ncbi:MAG: DNA alkylation repair protein [Pseudomonadota bacterium]
MTAYTEIHKALLELAKTSSRSEVQFFKTGPGDYAEHDHFLGIRVPILRKLAKAYVTINATTHKKLLSSAIHEERQLALFILVLQYERGTPEQQKSIVQFYLDHLNHVNNWDLVDCSAPYILGHHLLTRSKTSLKALSKSTSLWERRIAIVATATFIKNSEYDWTLTIAKALLEDEHDLIHKAVGWMLREVGIREKRVLVEFLDSHAAKMPRTMLRYAIEKFTDLERKHYLKK